MQNKNRLNSEPIWGKIIGIQVRLVALSGKSVQSIKQKDDLVSLAMYFHGNLL